jgi:hypothetical protein
LLVKPVNLLESSPSSSSKRLVGVDPVVKLLTLVLILAQSVISKTLMLLDST